MKITNPRQSPRVPFDLRLEAEEKDPGTWELLLHLRSARGGGSEVEFFLPDDAELLEGSLRAEFFLDPGAPRTERILARIPSEGYCALAASAVVAGRREEAYAEFGERPGAEAKGLRIRTRAAGERILRIGPTDEE